MPIKWSAVQVDAAMDAVEHQLDLAVSFLNEAKALAAAARKIPNLPQYLDQRIFRVALEIERLDMIRSAIACVRREIPKGAIDDELRRTRHGSQESFL